MDLGTDVYEYSNITDYQALKNSGVVTVIQKATEGLNHNDSLLGYRYQHLTQYGFKIGFYHFARNNDPVAEAQHFINQVSGLHSDTVYWLDIEDEDSWGRQDAINYANGFLNYMQSQGYKTGVYTGLAFYYDYLQGNIPNVPLWLASYGRQPAEYPDSASWQYTESGQVGGIEGNADLDYFISSAYSNYNGGGNNGNNGNNDNNGKWGGYDIQKVKSLQQLLNGLGLGDLTVDGEFGDSTLQAAIKLPIAQVDGYHNEAYTDFIQRMLGIDVDGIYGYGTESAVKGLQASSGLEADGKVGINTLKELVK